MSARSEVRARVGRAARRVNRSPRVHMLHIGKTGGTAVKDALKPVLGAGRYEIVLHGHRDRLDSIPAGEKVFFVVRDPVERYVSGFNSRLRCGRPRHDRPWRPEEKVVFTEFPSPDSLGQALSSSDGEVRARAFTAMHSIAHVRDSYWDWLGTREYLGSRADDVLMVIWCPDLTPAFPRLREALGLPESLELPTDPLRTHRAPSSVDRTLGEVALTNLSLWYGRDYEAVRLCAALPTFAGPSYTGLTPAPVAESARA